MDACPATRTEPWTASPRDPRLVHGCLPLAHHRPGRRVAGHPRGIGRAGRRPHRFGQDPGRLPCRPGPARLDPSPADPKKRCRVLYVSPLKALAVDVERNLRSPLTGIRQESVRMGLPEPEVRVGIRSGDTPAAERRSLATRPPDILITTPESLFLMLTSATRDALTGIETVILDEVHAVSRHQARRPPGALPGAAGRPPPETGPPHRPLRDGPSGRRGGPFPLAPAQGGDRPAGVGQGVRPVRGRPGRRPGRAGRLPRLRRLGGGRAPFDLAARRGADRRPRPVPPLHDRVRELPCGSRSACATV